MVRGARNADAYCEALVIAVYDACIGGLLQVLDGITMHQVDVAALNALLTQCIEHLLCVFVDVVAVFNADALQFWIHVGHTQNNRTQARAHVDESIVDAQCCCVLRDLLGNARSRARRLLDRLREWDSYVRPLSARVGKGLRLEPC